MDPTNLTLPVARIVQGDVYKMSDKDSKGKPRVIKTGPNAGKPFSQNFFAVAIPKTPGLTHWSQEKYTDAFGKEVAWGQIILNIGYQAFPAVYQRPDFSWKIEDGDSQMPNKNGRINAKTEGMPGHWIVKLSNGFAPTVYRHDGKNWAQAVEPFIKCGDYVQVAVSVKGNESTDSPGVYINPGMVAFNNYGTAIISGPDPTEAGFAAPPAGAVPPAMPMPSAPFVGAGQPAPGAPYAPAVAGMVPSTMGYAPSAGTVGLPAASVAPIAVTPNPGILNVPAVPAVAPPPPAAPVHRMTAKAAGASYEALIGAGWNDALLVQHGMMEP